MPYAHTATGVFPLIIVSMVIHLKFHTGFTSDADKLYAGANQMVTEAFSSIRVIHAYNLQGFIAGSYEKMIVSGPLAEVYLAPKHAARSFVLCLLRALLPADLYCVAP